MAFILSQWNSYTYFIKFIVSNLQKLNQLINKHNSEIKKILFNVHCLMNFFLSENHYKNEVMVDNEPVIFEIVDTCPRVSRIK